MAKKISIALNITILLKIWLNNAYEDPKMANSLPS